MSFGKMNTFITIVEKQHTTDDEGFKTESDVSIAEVRAYREGRQMRILCDGHTFEITSVEDVRGKGMYLEVLVEEVKQSG